MYSGRTDGSDHGHDHVVISPGRGRRDHGNVPATARDLANGIESAPATENAAPNRSQRKIKKKTKINK